MDDKAARALAGAMASLASGGDPAMAAPVTARLAGAERARLAPAG